MDKLNFDENTKNKGLRLANTPIYDLIGALEAGVGKDMTNAIQAEITRRNMVIAAKTCLWVKVAALVAIFTTIITIINLAVK